MKSTVATFAYLCVIPTLAFAQAVATFSHKASAHRSLNVEVAPGEHIAVHISETCPNAFTYEYKGYERPDTDKDVVEVTGASRRMGRCESLQDEAALAAIFVGQSEEALLNAGRCLIGSTTLTITHEDRFGAYLVGVTRTDKQKDQLLAIQRSDLEKMSQEFIQLAKQRFNEEQQTYQAVLDDINRQRKDNRKPPIASLDELDDDEVEDVEEETLARLEVMQECEELMESAAMDVTGRVPGSALGESSFIVSIERSPVWIDFAGGFTVSRLTNPVFAVVSNPSDPATSLVIRDGQAEDDYRLGLAGFIHVSGETWKVFGLPLSATLGLGITETNDLNYLIGLSARGGRRFFFTVGANFTGVDRLPAGQQLGAAPIDANVLNNLGKRTDSAFAFSFSYSFLNPGSSFFSNRLATKDDSK